MLLKKIMKWGVCIPLILGSTLAYAQTAKEAGQKGLDFITSETVSWQNRNQACFACHTQGMSMWGASIGTVRGYDVNQDQLAQIVSRVVETQDTGGGWSHGGRARIMTTSIATSGLAYYDRAVATDAQGEFLEGADLLLANQSAGGAWVSDTIWTNDPREILRFGNNASVTAMSIITMRRAYEITKAPKYEQSYTAAAAWLSGQNPADTQSLGYKIMGLVEAQYAADHPAIVGTVNTLKARQNADGGFGYLAGSASSAFQTGVAVYALRLAGLNTADPGVSAGIGWLLPRQNANGSWPLGVARLDAGDPVGPNMWAVIALGEFGEFGVTVQATPESQEMLAFSPDEQLINYSIEVTNTGNSSEPDTFDLAVSGGFPGFTANLSDETVTLAAGQSIQVAFSILAPADLPFGFPVTYSISATSQSRAETFDIASVTSFTPPPPPSVGNNTSIQILEGANTSLTTRNTATFKVRVIDNVTNQYVFGGESGAVNFFAGGVSIGSDNDADGDGVFEIQWTPGQDWTQLGQQSLLVAYSGIDRPVPQDDLLSSTVVTGIEIFKSVFALQCGIADGAVRFDHVLDYFPFNGQPSLSDQYLTVQPAYHPEVTTAIIATGNASVNPDGSLAFSKGGIADVSVEFQVLIDGAPSGQFGMVTYVNDEDATNANYGLSSFPDCVLVEE